jgi:protein-S-isoprenylcysteine O-methyltransferase Ste14
MSRFPALLYGAACYAVFLATFLYAIAFVAGVGVPKHVDNGAATALPAALAIDLALLALFAIQHSGMARPAFKRWWTRIVPPAIERSTYVLASSLVLALLFWQWRPLPLRVWQADGDGARMALYGLSALGWLLVLSSTFLINHFDLFGLRQVWRHAHRRPPTLDTPFVTRAFYRIVRHPLMLGFLVAVKFLEERDLVAHFGDTYRDYQRRVPMLLPWRRPREAKAAAPMRSAGVQG